MRAAVNFGLPEQVDAYNILGLKVISGTVSESDWLTAFGTWVQTAYQNLWGVINNQVQLQSVLINKVIWTGVLWEVESLIGTVLPTFTPTNANDMLPHAVAGVVSFPTPRPKRTGKVNIAGLTEEAQDDSLLTAPVATSLASFATALRTSINAGGSVSRYNILHNDGQTSTTSGFSVNGIVGSQRKRKPGIGI